jgi:hypothetical protein
LELYLPIYCSEKLTCFVFHSEPNGQNAKSGYNVGELEQWCLCTLGYLKSFSRQYATEVSVTFWKIRYLQEGFYTNWIFPVF